MSSSRRLLQPPEVPHIEDMFNYKLQRHQGDNTSTHFGSAAPWTQSQYGR